MISTRLTKFFGIEHPIILAPMTPAAGADLSAAVAAAGGLGLLGGGYGDRSWFEAESAKITRNDVGCGLITWSVETTTGLTRLCNRASSAGNYVVLCRSCAFRSAHQTGPCASHLPGAYRRASPTSSRRRGRCCRCSGHGSGRPRPNSPVDVAVRADGGGRFEQTCS